MRPVCLKPGCPKALPMVLLDAESTATHREWYCPHDGMRRSEVTMLGRVGALAPPTLCVSGVVAIIAGVASLVHGDASGLHEMLDMPEAD